MGKISKNLATELTAFFLRNGYVRRHNAARYAEEGCTVYKKGDEVRLVANKQEEYERIVHLLKVAGFKSGRPFRKSPHRVQTCIPIYGREQVARFLTMVEETTHSHQDKSN